MEKRVGIFMQLYRNEPSMHKAIKSVLEQTYRNFRFYIRVSDKTKSAVLEYAQYDSRIEIIEGKPGENFRTYDKYIAQDDNGYFSVIDADDWYEKTYLEDLISFAESNKVDIVACGNYFVNEAEKICGTRKSEKIVWNVEDTGKILSDMYGFFRTLWGKLISSEVILGYSRDNLPRTEEYGGYGGDTISMFRILSAAKKIGICDKVLYYYRMSLKGDSGRLKEGRLNSDQLLFRFVKDTLSSLGKVGELQERFLYQIYGEATKDTTRLIKRQNLPEEEKAEMLQKIYDNEVTEELFERERTGRLGIPESPVYIRYVDEFYQMLFADVNICRATPKMVEIYLHIYETIRQKHKNLFSADEFNIILRSKELLDNLYYEKYQEMFSVLLELLGDLKLVQAKNCLVLLRRVTSVPFLKTFLQEKRFVLLYSKIFHAINCGENEKAFAYLKDNFETDTIPYQAEMLVEIWSDLAASIEDSEEYVFSKELEIEVFIRKGTMEKAKNAYDELVGLGVKDQNMISLGELLSQDEKNG